MPRNRSIRQILGENVQRLRAARKMSQPQVAAAAKRLGLPLDQRTVGRIEKGDIPTTIERLEATARALGVEPWQLLREEFKPDEDNTIDVESVTRDERELLVRYRNATGRWKVAIRHMAALRGDAAQDEAADTMNYTLAKIAAEPAKDERVAEAYGVPGAKAPPTLHDSAGERKK